MKITILPIVDIITIGKMIQVNVEDEDDGGDGDALPPGVYAFDSVGQVWQLHSAATELFAAFDVKDPQLARDRTEARDRFKAKLKDAKKRRRKDA